ncbi:MAG: hypothetical protein BWX55_00051 [Deltaproteobacteria bacterium ADurb.Bin022]|nr:MAG: hypothetical protein BWX55_00051 [Deltaproteobacteria bacterium ADurb.Bin022]
MKNKERADFCIEINFNKESEAPSRIFRALSDILDSFHAFDLDLIQSIDPKIEPVVLLEDIESGSVKSWLRYIFDVIDDDALKRLDWKPAVGKYLVKAKYIIIKFLDGKTEITNRSEIEDLNKNLLTLAQETNIRQIPAYSPLPTERLLINLQRITTATDGLKGSDSVKYLTSEDSIPFNLSFKIIPETIEDLMTKETIKSPMEMILKVKKPDYLGDSKWEFKHENKNYLMKILDEEWLAEFQNRQVDIRPGDSIRAKVQIIAKYGYDLNVVSIHHNILEIIDVIPFTPLDQKLLSF